jgi:hypothetical protein
MESRSLNMIGNGSDLMITARFDAGRLPASARKLAGVGLLVLVAGCQPALTVDAQPSSPASNSAGTGGTQASLGVTGVVRTPAGAPVSGAVVTAEGEAGSPPVPELAVITGGEGRFFWPLQPGRYRFTAQTPDGRRGTASASPAEETLIIIVR